MTHLTCFDCGHTFTRLGPPDSVGLCPTCGGIALDRDDPLFAPLFREQERTAAHLEAFKTGLRVARKPLEAEDAG